MVKMRFKKAVLITVSMFILAGVLLSLAIVIRNLNTDSAGYGSDTNAIDRADEIYSGIENSFRKIFDVESGIVIEADDDSVSFIEDLPNTNNVDLSSANTDLETFVEASLSEVEVEVGSINSALPLIIMPHDITYNHSNFGGNTIRVYASQDNFNSYNIFLYSATERFTSIDVVDETAGPLPITITADGIGGIKTYSSSISYNAESNYEIATIGAADPILVEFKYSTAPRYLRVTNDLESVLVSNITIGLASTDNEHVFVRYPEDTLDINFQNLGVRKTSGPVIR